MALSSYQKLRQEYLRAKLELKIVCLTPDSMEAGLIRGRLVLANELLFAVLFGEKKASARCGQGILNMIERQEVIDMAKGSCGPKKPDSKKPNPFAKGFPPKKPTSTKKGK